MKKTLKSLLLVTLLVCTTLPAWSQASTEGKDFWVANTIVCQPPTASSPAFPTIAVSAQKACTVTITDYTGNVLATANVADGSWTRFGNNSATVDPADYYLDPSKWYPTTNNINATDVYNHADKINNYGLHITATENVSVFVIMSTPQYSMDACNALPITALQSEYYLQDFYPYSKDVSKAITMTTILAVEDGTRVNITPKGNTYGKTNNGVPYTITLNKGQTYYLISSVNAQLAGTHIVAQDGKKIAVYVGSPNTHTPGGVSARDALFEQMMPIDYWGTQFIATRSLQKDGNIIGITATQNGTELKIDGFTQAYINEGETYYIVLQGPSDPYTKNLSKIVSPVDQVITADAIYIETSCPAAVISYDTGNSFAGATGSEIVNGQGDPSSVWMSPIQQKINRITFGACYTTKTKAHFLNIVTETATCDQTKLTAYMGQYGNDWSDKLTWTQVPGNPTYSYARLQIGNNTPTINVFTLENSKGFIAHIYGNGEDESYAYSAGSAAVERGVNVDGETFTNGFKSDSRFCLDRPLQFDSKVGTDEITRVDWTFGDGTSEYNGMPQTEHTYTSPGWYDVTAKLFGHQVCTNESDVELGTVHFTFRVMPPDTVYMKPEHRCISVDSIYDGRKLTAEEIAKMIANGGNDTTHVDPDDCASEVHITPVSYGIDTEEKLDTITGEDQAIGHNNKIYYASTDVIDTIPATVNRCAIYRKYYVKVITCLAMTVTNDSAAQHVCPNNTLDIEYTKTKGDLGEARFVIPGVLDEEVNIDNYNTQMGKLSLPTQNLKPGLYKGELKVEDQYCDDKTFPIDVAVYYPKDIFLYKFNNVLAVYKKGFGGNNEYNLADYTFQWYRNYLPIEGATESVLYLGDGVTFEIGDEVHVALIDKNGVRIPSCGQTITSVPDYNKPDQQQAPARKMIINNKIVIQREDQTYDIYGQKVR